MGMRMKENECGRVNEFGEKKKNYDRKMLTIPQNKKKINKKLK
jgi:hypothetical protein